MGAKVRGAGTGTIRIEGVDKLYGANHSIIPDRIEAGTFMVAAAITGGDILIENAVPEHLRSITAKWKKWVLKLLRKTKVYVLSAQIS